MLQPKALAVVNEVRKAILGKDAVVCKVLMAILARGHILLEDNPGVGKTTLALAFSKAGAALLLEEKDCTARSMYDAVRALLDDPKRLAAMHEAALGLAIFDSAQRIYDNIMTLIR